MKSQHGLITKLSLTVLLLCSTPAPAQTLIDYAVIDEDLVPQTVFSVNTPTFGPFGTPPAVGLTFHLSDMPAHTTFRFQYLRPDSTLAFDSGTFDVGNPDYTYSVWYYYWFIYRDVPGEWSIVLDVNGVTLVTAPFTVDACSVPNLSQITDPVAVQFENQAPTAPAFSLYNPDIDFLLELNMSAFQSAARSRFGVTLPRTSGYRPLSYQAHLYELRTKLINIENAISNDPSQQDACAQLKATIDDEVDNKHQIVRDVNGLPKVNPPSLSEHTRFPANAVDLSLGALSITQLIQLDFLASQHGLARPCSGSSVHFTKSGVACSQVIRAEVQSPVNILITDPNGKRIGFDPITQSVVNEMGTTAFYSGPNTEPQFIEVGGVLPGRYAVTGVGSASGSYRLTLDQVDEDSGPLTHQIITGSATQGIAIPPATVQYVPIAVQVSTTASGLAYSRVSKMFSGTVTIKNISTSALNGPFQILFTSLPSGVTLANATGTFNGSPFITVPSVTSLAPGQSATVSVQFSDPSNVKINFTPVIYSGSFN